MPNRVTAAVITLPVMIAILEMYLERVGENIDSEV